MSDSTFDLSFESELDEFDPLEDTGADDDDSEGGDYTAISSATDAPAQQSEAKTDDRTPAERIDDLFKSMAPRRKVLLGILEPTETILLSTHLLEEVQHFISRAVLLHQGKVAGDVTTLELEEQGRGLMDFVKETYRYQADRVSRALDQLTDRE